MQKLFKNNYTSCFEMKMHCKTVQNKVSFCNYFEITSILGFFQLLLSHNLMLPTSILLAFKTSRARLWCQNSEILETLGEERGEKNVNAARVRYQD